MDFLTYIQTLQNELSDLNLTKDAIHSITAKEYALAEATGIDDIPSIFTDERLHIILSQAKQAKETQTPESVNEEQTIIQYSHSTPIEEKTIFPTNHSPVKSLTDEATMVVISDNSQDALEEETIALPPTIKKLLSENETVKISEKDTAFFQVDSDRTAAFQTEEATVQIKSFNEEATVKIKSFNEEATVQIPSQAEELTVQIRPRTEESTVQIRIPKEEATVLIPSPTEDDTVIIHQPKKKTSDTEDTLPLHSTPPTPKTPYTTEIEKIPVTPAPTSDNQHPKNTAQPSKSPVPLTPESIRNPHPHVSFVWLFLLLIPSIALLSVLIASFIVLANLFFLIAFTAVMLIYLSLLLIPLFAALYSTLFSFLYLKDFRISNGIIELGIALFSSGVSLLLGYLLYRPFITIAELIGTKCKSFNQKTFKLVRNLYRYSVKGAEKL